MESIFFNLDYNNRGRFSLSILRSYDILKGKGVKLGEINTQIFSDNEVSSDLHSSVRGKRVYLLMTPNTSDKILTLNFAIDAAKRSGASEIIPILPYFPYARADKKDYVRGPISSKVIAEMLENRGATQVVTFDLHAEQIQGFFNIPVTHLEGKYLFSNKIIDMANENPNIVLCAPDAGATKRVKGFRDWIKNYSSIDLPIVVIDKTRPKANEVGEMVLIGDVKGKNVVIIDDMCDTGGTLVKASEELINNGAKNVNCIVTHGVLSGPAFTRISESIDKGIIKDFIISNSITSEQHENSRIKIVDCSKHIAASMVAIDNNISIDILKQEI